MSSPSKQPLPHRRLLSDLRLLLPPACPSVCRTCRAVQQLLGSILPYCLRGCLRLCCVALLNTLPAAPPTSTPPLHHRLLSLHSQATVSYLASTFVLRLSSTTCFPRTGLSNSNAVIHLTSLLVNGRPGTSLGSSPRHLSRVGLTINDSTTAICPTSLRLSS